MQRVFARMMDDVAIASKSYVSAVCSVTAVNFLSGPSLLNNNPETIHRRVVVQVVSVLGNRVLT